MLFLMIQSLYLLSFLNLSFQIRFIVEKSTFEVIKFTKLGDIDASTFTVPILLANIE